MCMYEHATVWGRVDRIVGDFLKPYLQHLFFDTEFYVELLSYLPMHVTFQQKNAGNRNKNDWLPFPHTSPDLGIFRLVRKTKS